MLSGVVVIKSHISQLTCPPDITDIDQCSHRGWGSHDCSHSEDVRLECFCEYLSVTAK